MSSHPQRLNPPPRRFPGEGEPALPLPRGGSRAAPLGGWGGERWKAKWRHSGQPGGWDPGGQLWKAEWRQAGQPHPGGKLWATERHHSGQAPESTLSRELQGGCLRWRGECSSVENRFSPLSPPLSYSVSSPPSISSSRALSPSLSLACLPSLPRSRSPHFPALSLHFPALSLFTVFLSLVLSC